MVFCTTIAPYSAHSKFSYTQLFPHMCILYIFYIVLVFQFSRLKFYIIKFIKITPKIATHIEKRPTIIATAIFIGYP